jgi:hypothetical protein
MKHCFFRVAAAVFLAALAAPARADMFGVRAGVYTNLSDAFVGAEALVPLSHSVYLNPNFEYVFVPDQTYFTVNGDFHYDFRTHSRAYVWAGGGLAIIYDSPPAPFPSKTDVGANFLVGVGLKGHVIPYVQAKLIAKSNAEFVLGFGLRF